MGGCTHCRKNAFFCNAGWIPILLMVFGLVCLLFTAGLALAMSIESQWFGFEGELPEKTEIEADGTKTTYKYKPGFGETLKADNPDGHIGQEGFGEYEWEKDGHSGYVKQTLYQTDGSTRNVAPVNSGLMIGSAVLGVFLTLAATVAWIGPSNFTGCRNNPALQPLCLWSFMLLCLVLTFFSAGAIPGILGEGNFISTEPPTSTELVENAHLPEDHIDHYNPETDAPKGDNGARIACATGGLIGIPTALSLMSKQDKETDDRKDDSEDSGMSSPPIKGINISEPVLVRSTRENEERRERKQLAKDVKDVAKRRKAQQVKEQFRKRKRTSVRAPNQTPFNVYEVAKRFGNPARHHTATTQSRRQHEGPTWDRGRFRPNRTRRRLMRSRKPNRTEIVLGRILDEINAKGKPR